MKREKTIAWRNSITLKHLTLFGIVILVIMILTSLLHIGAINIARQATYDKMSAQAGYYLRTIDSELEHIRSLQLNFFIDRKLIYLSDPAVNISTYEKREALLSVKERIASINGISNMLGEITLYIPKSEYIITSSDIRNMQESDFVQLESYYGYTKGMLIENEHAFFMLENGTAKTDIDEGTLFLLVFTFPKNKLMERMGVGVDESREGAFFYSDKYGAIAEGEVEQEIAEAIMKQLVTDEAGRNISTQLVNVGKERYLVLADESQMLGTYIQYSRENPIMIEIYRYRNYMYVVWIFIGLLAVWFVYYTQKMIRNPIDKLLEAFTITKTGKFDEHIYHNKEDEFSYLFAGYNDMIDQINHLVNEVLLQKNLIQKVELKHLQAQINPHFLYNSFFVLSRRVKRHDYENAEKFSILLGNYFKFLTRSSSDFIELKQEVEHARCYAEIQGTRFSGRIDVVFRELPLKYESLKVPRLILQPLLENSFEHGLEEKEQDGRLEVSFEETPDTFSIHVEDNGDMAAAELIEQMQDSLSGSDDEEITGIINIHKRLGIHFAGRAGLHVKRSRLGGVCVSIWLKGG